MDATISHTNTEDVAFARFLSLYPSYKDTMAIDTLRHKEYPHLDEGGQVYLDYTGVALFSHSQRSPELYGGFGIGLSHTSANLATHAMYMEGGSTENFFRKRILRYLNLDEDDYYIVFTANAFSAFKLLGQSYPFHEAQSLLRAYDHECENLEALSECAHAKGGLVQSVNLLNPWMKIDRDDLRKKLQGKKKASSQKVTGTGRGLFAYPYMSRVTGCINSSQWIAEAQQNGWHVLLDVTSVDAKFSDTLGLALFSPDFLIGSFYYVFGEDPTGFGCLVMKKSVLRTLGDSSRARAIGMMKIVTRRTSSSSPDESPPESSGCIMDPPLKLFSESPGHRRTLSMHGLSFVAESAADSTTLERTSSLIQDDSGCFKTSIRDKREIDRVSISMKTLGLSRMHMDALLSVELATPNEFITPAASGVERSRDNGAFNTTRVSCDFEMGSQSEAVMSASLHDVSKEIEEIQPVHSHGRVSVDSDEAVRKLQRNELKERQYRYGDGTGHGSSKSSSKNETSSVKKPLQKTSGMKSSEDFLRTESTSQSAGRSTLIEKAIPLDSWQAASSNILSSVSSSFKYGTSKVPSNLPKSKSRLPHVSMDIRFTCAGLDHADMLGYQRIAIRLRALANWLVSSLSILRHPQPGNAKLVRIYSQMSIVDRGSIIAFTVVDSTGKVFHPERVQVLADRSSICLRTGVIAGRLSSEMPDAEDEPRDMGCVELSHYKWRAKGEAMLNVHIPVAYVSLGFLNNFSDVYKLWLFISRFLDPDFVSQELWHYQALNQETIAI